MSSSMMGAQSQLTAQMAFWFVGLSLSIVRLRPTIISWRQKHVKQIARWRGAMVTLLFIAAPLQIDPDVLQAASFFKFSVFWIVFWRRLVLFADLLRLSCDLLQIFLFTITIQQSARYSPRDQSVFYWVARLEYTFVGILAIWHLLYNCLMLPPPYVAISVLVSMVRMVSTSILFAASILLKVRSNPEREESKALNWLVAGTTVLFFRSVAFDILPYSGFRLLLWPWIIKSLVFLAIILADEFHSRAVVLQSSDSSPLPVWLLSGVETED